MKVKCHNQDCKNIFDFSGKSTWVNCPICSSRIPLSQVTSNESNETTLNNINSSSIKNRLRIWLISHKSINPYNFFNNSGEYKVGNR